MGQKLVCRLRWLLPVVAGIACAFLVSVLSQARGATVPLSISVQGNHFVDGSGQTVRLLGVNHPSFEYACEYGYAYNDGNMNADDAAAIASWHATAVRVPLNEDCWLGINGRPSNEQNPPPAEPLTADGYRSAVEQYVTDLNKAGLYVILDLHWTAPGKLTADGQRPMPDDHSAAFWTSVASTFASNPAVVFDAFNEPYSPDKVNDPDHPVSWTCWESGGCILPEVNDSEQPDGQTYTAVGMQTLVDAIRNAGAHNPILLGGLNYANDLTGWLAHEPTDPDGQLAASFHNYQGLGCDTQSCWDSEVAPVAAQVPVVGGEFDQDVCQPSTFDVDYMNWADQDGVGYLAWGWWVLSPKEITDAGCSAFYLITDTDGTPAAPNGVNLHDHLAALAGGSTSPPPGTATGTGHKKGPRLSGFHAHLSAHGKAVTFVVKANRKCSAVISGRTVKSFAAGAAKRHGKHVSFGAVRFTLKADKTKTAVLNLSPTSRAVLAKLLKVKVRFTITLKGSAHSRTVAHRTVTLKLPSPRH
jgi:hypothetical protein